MILRETLSPQQIVWLYFLNYYAGQINRNNNGIGSSFRDMERMFGFTGKTRQNYSFGTFLKFLTKQKVLLFKSYRDNKIGSPGKTYIVNGKELKKLIESQAILIAYNSIIYGTGDLKKYLAEKKLENLLPT